MFHYVVLACIALLVAFYLSQMSLKKHGSKDQKSSKNAHVMTIIFVLIIATCIAHWLYFSNSATASPTEYLSNDADFNIISQIPKGESMKVGMPPF